MFVVQYRSGPQTCHESMEQVERAIKDADWLRVYETINGVITGNIYPNENSHGDNSL